MIGIIALSGSLFFSLFMIVRDCRRRRSVSVAIWIPTILVMILASRPVSSWLANGRTRTAVELANEESTSSVDQIFYLAVLSSALVIVLKRRLRLGRFAIDNPAIMLFYIYFALSVLWSSDPSGSSKRLIKDFGLLLVAGIIYSEKDPLDAMRAVYVRCAYVLLPLSVIFIKYVPDYGRSYGLGGEMLFTGVTTQKNGLGETVLLFSLFIIWDYLESRSEAYKQRWSRFPWETVLLLFNAAWLLRISQSKTALVCVFVGVVLLWRRRSYGSKLTNLAILLGALSLPAMLFFSAEFSDAIAPLLHALGRNTTFTGRTQIWEHINMDTVNPWIGSGYWNFWGGPGGERINEAMVSLIPNAHDGYLDVYLDGGMIGLALLYLVLFTSGTRIARYLARGKDSDHFQRMRFAILIIVIIYNLSETAFARISAIWFTSLLMIVDFRAFRAAIPLRRTASKASVSRRYEGKSLVHP
jgi:exopolysaccharide production protein ExoQ